ncbi:MAG: hypothetical protein RLP44_05155 [Aggregatilineales bacterium]
MRNKSLLIFISMMLMALLLAACGGDADDSTEPTEANIATSDVIVDVTDEPTEVALAEITPEMTVEMDMTEELTPEVILELTEDMVQMADMTAEATIEMEVTDDMDMTDEMTPIATMDMEATEDMTPEVTMEATDDMDMTAEMTAEATMEATNDMDMTAEATVEVDMEPSFMIEVTGAVTLSFDEESGEFSYDYEEPATSIGPENTASPNSGIYTFTFRYTDDDDVETLIFVTFSDNFEEGIYTTPDEITEEEASDDAFIPLIVGSVNVSDDLSFTTVLDGVITLDQFADELASGSFDFTLANTDNLDETVTLSVEFENLEVQTNPLEAVDEVETDG